MPSRSNPNTDTCRKGLHAWVEENIYTDPQGHRTCRPCKTTAQKNPDPHPMGTNRCRRGHEYTPENTKKRVRMINGEKRIYRDCITCAKQGARTTKQ